MTPFYFGIDPTYVLVTIGIAVSGTASAYINGTFRKYDQVRSSKHVTGMQAAQYTLQKEQVNDVGIQQVAGDLTDNYSSESRMLSSSEVAAQPTSVAVTGVAAHERERAVQDHTSYVPLRLRAAIVPVTSVGSAISFPLVLFDVLFSWNQTLINIGILAFSLALIFQLMTLPMEFSVSRRVLSVLSEGGLLVEEEVPMARKVPFVVALTYIATALSTSLQLLCLVILFGDDNRRD